MIIARLSGGLGNQLFQYATARRLAEINGTEVTLDLTAFQGGGGRPFRLDAFRISARPATAHDIALRAERVVAEPAFGYHPAIMGFPDDVVLHGYWQTEKYFAESRDLLRRELAFRDDAVMAAARTQVAALRRDGRPVVALHARRGDYVGEYAGLFHSLSVDWYRAAMALFPDAWFVAVSDDPAWIGAALPGDRLTIAASADDLADFALMRACDHHIIANSTFSWWAAWLADAEAPRVVVPDPVRCWFGPRLATRDATHVLPARWHPLAEPG
jgi:hypothetical protein